ncbi:helix-turn-helix domain-containing protein [Prevotella melaninogenica]|uniref:helix-turn-helix domain-containing protein n=1 Tax=Prevotella melaninogenica TaxID=28132 RepID=UPI002151EB02|nr:helix-turn-helix transcriptional regulator [Prevotella melaninogenica]
MEKLLEFFRNERLNKCLKQAYLAEKLGVDESTISRWASGQTVMTFLQIENYASALEIDVYEMFAYLASNGQDLPRPIAEIHVEVYTKEAYNSLMQYLANSGMDITIKSTKLKRWK